MYPSYFDIPQSVSIRPPFPACRAVQIEMSGFSSKGPGAAIIDPDQLPCATAYPTGGYRPGRVFPTASCRSTRSRSDETNRNKSVTICNRHTASLSLHPGQSATQWVLTAALSVDSLCANSAGPQGVTRRHGLSSESSERADAEEACGQELLLCHRERCHCCGRPPAVPRLQFRVSVDRNGYGMKAESSDTSRARGCRPFDSSLVTGRPSSKHHRNIRTWNRNRLEISALYHWRQGAVTGWNDNAR